MPKVKSVLSQKQEKFWREYLIDRNATQAAIRAGYSKKTAHSQGPRLLENVEIIKRINDLFEKENKEITNRRHKVLRELEYIAFGRPDQIFSIENNKIKFKDFSEMEESAKACLANINESYYDGELSSRNVKFHDKIKALELLLKYTQEIESNILGSSENEQKEKEEAMALFANIMKDAYADRTGNKE